MFRRRRPLGQPAVPKSYLVFFDFNKSDLTPQALISIVDTAAAKNAEAGQGDSAYGYRSHRYRGFGRL